MENTKNTNIKKAAIKSVKLNVDYIAFVKRAQKEKLIETLSKEKLIKEYLAQVKMRSYKNISRVNKRAFRPELEDSVKELIKGVSSYEEFKTFADTLTASISDKKGLKYIEVKSQ